MIAALAAAAPVVGLLNSDASAATKSWIGPAWATWNAASNWSPNGAPAGGDTVNVFSTNGQNKYVTYSLDGATAPILNDVYIDSDASNCVSILDHGSDTLDAGYTFVGYNGWGQYVQHGGTLRSTAHAERSLVLGYSATANGLYELNAGTVITNATEIGVGGAGFFRQNFGVQNTGTLTIAEGIGSSGTYRLNDGSLTFSSGLKVGLGGAGTFIADGGAMSGSSIELARYNGSTGTFVHDGPLVSLTGSTSIGIASGSNGTYSLSQGTLSKISLTVGDAGDGTFLHTAGQVNANSTVIGRLSTSTGYYGLAGSAFLNCAETTIADFGTATFLQTGGNVNGTINIGRSAGSQGTYNLVAGAMAPVSLNVGSNSGRGVLDQSGGTALVGSMTIGSNSGVGTYHLSGSTSTLSANSLNVGVGGIGTIVLDGGSFSVAKSTTIGNASFKINSGSFSTGTLAIATGQGESASFTTTGPSTVWYKTTIGNNGSYRANGWITFFGDVQSGGTIEGNGGLVYAKNITGAGTIVVNKSTFSAWSVQQQAVQLGSASASAELKIAAGQTNPRLNRLESISILKQNGGYNGRLDLTDNDLVISGTPYATVRDLVVRGRARGDAIMSSTAAASAETELGLLSGAEYLSMHGNGATFGGVAVQPTDSIIKYTWAGDANLDGRVTFDDYVRIDSGFNQRLTGWANGDFDYSGVVNFDDYVLIDIAFNSQNGTLSRAIVWISGEDRSGSATNGIAAVVEHFDHFGPSFGAAFLAAVPEPTSLAAITTAFLITSRRQRRARRD